MKLQCIVSTMVELYLVDVWIWFIYSTYYGIIMNLGSFGRQSDMVGIETNSGIYGTDK